MLAVVRRLSLGTVLCLVVWHLVMPAMARIAALPDPLRSALVQAEQAFAWAVPQSASFPESISHVHARWNALDVAAQAYLTDETLFRQPAPKVAHLLSAINPLISYIVQDFNTGIGPMRLVIYGYHWEPCISGQYDSLIALWQEKEHIRESRLWGVNDYKDTSAPALLSQVQVGDLRAWRSGKTAYMAAIEDGCGHNGQTIAGATLRPQSLGWTSDPAMFPSDPFNGVKTQRTDVCFSDPAGLRIYEDPDIFNDVIGESEAGDHVASERYLVRGSDNVYHPTPWQLIPSSYATLVEAVGAARSAQKQSIADCTPAAMAFWIESNQVAIHFCAIDWTQSVLSWDRARGTRGGMVYTLSVGGEVLGEHLVRVSVSAGPPWHIIDVTKMIK